MKIRNECVYLVLATLFSVIVILSNLITVKLISVPYTTLAIPCGLITYPLSFLIGDLITEVFGEEKAKFVVYLGFGMALVSLLIIKTALILPPHSHWAAEKQFAFASVFNISSMALMSSVLGYAAAQLMDIKLFAFLRDMTHKKHLWLRNVGSTLTSQVIDTLIVNVLLLYCGLRLELDVVIKISLICYIYKCIVTLTNVPLFYGAVWAVKKYLSRGKEKEHSQLVEKFV